MNYPTFQDRYGQRAGSLDPGAAATSVPEQVAEPSANPWGAVPEGDAPMPTGQQQATPNPWAYEGK